jgi:hypothetical protein
MGELKMKNCKENHKDDIKDTNINQQKKPFSLFTCKKEEFKDWFDPL